MMKRRAFFHSLFGGLLSSSCFLKANPSVKSPSGLYVHNGTLMRGDKPFHGIGANYFDLFARRLQNPSDTSSLTNLRALGQAGIPFVRFMCGGYWPSEQRLYMENPSKFFALMDSLVEAAQRCGIGLIPSLFWNYSTPPDLMQEPMQALGDPHSRTITYIRQYTKAVVTRYLRSPAIWGWEFGNEYNLVADLPNPAKHLPPVAPQLGTPRSRSERDELHWNEIQVAMLAFAKTVRRYDPYRILLTGNSIPRTSAYHNVHNHTWQLDTPDQFGAILLRDNPTPFNTICIHLYPDPQNIYPGGTKSLGEAINRASVWAKRANKPLLVEEFGVSQQQGPADLQKKIFEEFLQAFQKFQVPLAAFWVFDFPAQNADWNVTFQNDRSWMLSLVAEANRANN